MNRRQFYLGLTAALTAGAGCVNWSSDSTPEATETPSPEPETLPETAPESPETTRDTADTETETPSAPETFLPEVPDDWEFVETRDWGWSVLGVTAGVIAEYRGPDGHPYEIVVMDVEAKGRHMACAGWQWVTEAQGHMIAASTGTFQREFTPEKPPTMTRSPAPEKEDRVLGLLTYSPRLTEEEIRENSVDCPMAEWRTAQETTEETNRTEASD